MTQSWTYTLTGQVRTETNGAFTATYEYDELWRLRVVRENGVVQATYTYDVNGNRASKAYANGVVTTYTYNLANMVTRLENRRGTAVLSSYAYVYQLDGNMVRKTDHTGRVTAFTYDGLGRLTRESESGAADAKTYVYTFDGRGNRASMIVSGNRASKTYANGVVTTYTYNHANMVTRLENRRGTATLSSYSYVYQLDGNMVRKTDHTGRVTAFTYDGLGRLVREQESGAADAKTYVYTFDGRGNRASMVVSGAESYRVDYTYDVNNRLLTSTKTQPR